MRRRKKWDRAALRRRAHEVLEAGHANDRLSTLFDAVLVTLIITNVIAFAVGTMEAAAPYETALEAFNIVSVAIFTVEYAARLWACVELPPWRHLPHWRARLRFARRPLLLVDLAAILPFYLSFLLPLDLRVLRVLRLLRFFKVARYSPALQTLGRVFSNERRALYGALIIMASALLISSTVIYFLERHAQPEVFGSVPDAAWWALATLTTVGYGDAVPVTAMGRLFGGVVMIFGLGMFALPIGIVATGFVQEVNRREFVVTWSMVARVPAFEQLNAAAISKLMSVLRAQSFPAGAMILGDGDVVDAIYFIAAGEVAVEEGGRRQVLNAGEYFGDDTLHDPDKVEGITAVAVSNCDLLMLERDAFKRLLRENDELRKQVRAAARARDEKAEKAHRG